MTNKGPIIFAVIFTLVFLGLWLGIDLFVIPTCWRCFYLFAGPLLLQILSIILFMATLWSLFGWWKSIGGKVPFKKLNHSQEDEVQLVAMSEVRGLVSPLVDC